MRVEIFSSSGFRFFGSDFSDGSGVYEVGGLPDGTYVAVTDEFGTYINQVYDGVDCPGFFFSCDLTAGTPLAVAADTTVSGIDFALDRFGRITGTVTDAVTGDPVTNLRVDIYRDDGTFVNDDFVDSTGFYSVPNLRAGSYHARTDTFFDADHFDELYQELPCPDGSCDVTTGTAIAVALNADTSGIDFTLDPGGAVSGTVTEAATGDPISFASISIWDASGDVVRSGSTDFSGNYSLGRLETGNYFVTAERSQYAAELYDDLPCPGGPPAGCDPTTGTAVAVTFNASTSGVDFALERLGSISGTVTDADTGQSIFARVRLWDDSGTLVATRSFSSSYNFTGLADGTYYVTAQHENYLDEVYDDLPCSGCDPTTGTPVAAALNTSTSGIDFALQPLGAIRGTVRDAVTGDPIYFAGIDIWNTSGVNVRSAFADSNGEYSLRLPDGTYFVTAGQFGYLGELYDGLACSGCDPTAGTPVAVSLGTSTSGVDFSLDRPGSISGIVATASGQPVSGAETVVWDSAGSVVDFRYTDSAGSYTIGGLAPGTYFATVRSGYGSLAFADQLFSGLPCPGGPYMGCDPTTGTPILVGLNSTATANFLVDDPGTIHGSVAAEDGTLLAGVQVRAWSADGSSAGTGTTNVVGAYAIANLQPGDYFVGTESSLPYLDEAYEDVPCLDTCDFTKATPVEVLTNGTTRVDFVLQLFGAIGGRLTDEATGDPLPAVLVRASDAQGQVVATAVSGLSGNYLLSVGLGTFHVSTANSLGFIDEVYDDISCASGCDPAEGASIAVGVSGSDAVATEIDFALTDGLIFSDGFESGDVSAW